MLILVTLGIVVATVYLIPTLRETPRAGSGGMPGGDLPPRVDRFHLRDVHHVFTRDGVPIFEIDVGEMTHRRRRIGPLAINPLKEVEMREVRIRTDARSTASGEDEPTESALSSVQPMLEEVLERSDAGLVTGIEIQGLRFESLREGRLRFTLTAAGASLDLGRGELFLEGHFLLETASGERLEAPEASWDAEARAFAIDGPYVLSRAGGREVGTAARFALGADGRLQQR
ncbi:MAG: hypothetical protein PVF68_07410 [Acidobacteriota bacterium]